MPHPLPYQAHRMSRNETINLGMGIAINQSNPCHQPTNQMRVYVKQDHVSLAVLRRDLPDVVVRALIGQEVEVNERFETTTSIDNQTATWALPPQAVRILEEVK